MDKFIQELKLVCDEASTKLKEIRERMSALDKLLIGEPQLIQGYTAEQWQEIIDGGYLCEVGSGDTWWTGLISSMGNGEFWVVSSDGEKVRYGQCRPAQIKGIMRPIFVAPVDVDTECVFIYSDHSAPVKEQWRKFFIGSLTPQNTSVKKYIEL